MNLYFFLDQNLLDDTLCDSMFILLTLAGLAYLFPELISVKETEDISFKEEKKTVIKAI